MVTLAGQIQVGREQFNTGLSGGIDTSSLATVSGMSLGFLASSSDNPDQYIGSKLHPTVEAFSDFDTLGRSGESANIGHSKEFWNEKISTRKENEENKDQVSNAAAELRDDTQEKLREQIRNINGFVFSDADLEEAINDIINDKEAFQAKYDLTDDEADQALEHAILMQAMSPDERAEYLKEISETNPRVANAIAQKAEMNKLDREHKIEETVTVKQELEHEEFFDIPEDDPILAKADSVISTPFAQEVANIGQNAESFKPKDQAANIDVQDSAPTALELSV